MKTIKIRENKHQLPDSWQDLTLRQFLQIRELEKHINEMEQLDYSLNFIHVVTNIPLDELENMTAVQYNEVLNDMLALTKSEIIPVDLTTYKIGETTFVFDSDANKMELGMFNDLDKLMKEKDTWANAHKIAATFMRPSINNNWDTFKNSFKKKKNFNISTYDFNQMNDTAEIFMDHLPMTHIYTIIVFFLIFVQKLEQFMRDYSQVHQVEIPLTEKMK